MATANILTVYLVCLSYLLIAADSQRCKPQYSYSEEARGWLKLHMSPAPWNKALQTCLYEGAMLASPLDVGLVDALSSMAQKRVNGPIFLGTHNMHSSNYFVSMEGVPLSSMEVNWAPQIARHIPTELCLTMTFNETLQYINVTSCKDALPYICYRKVDNRTMNECGTLDDAYQLNKHTGSCYKVHDKKKVVWREAYEVCAAEGAHLVIINNQEEALVIKNMIPAAYSGSTNKWDAFHIGLYRNSEELDWITLHGDRIDDVFNNWDPNQPDGGTPSHATIIRDGTLDDDIYTSLHRFVCERSPTALQFEPLSGQYTEIEQTLNC